MSASSLWALMPLVVTSGTACLVLVLGVLAGARARAVTTWIGVAASALVVVTSAMALPGAEEVKPIFADMWITDRLALLLDVLIATATGMTLVVFHPFSREHGFERDEFPALVLFVASGMMMVVHATHLLSLLIASRPCPSGPTCWLRVTTAAGAGPKAR